MPFVQVAPQLGPGAGNRVWGRYPAGHQGDLALACPPSTGTLCPPVASTEGATGRRQAPDAQTSRWAGRGQARCSRDPDLWVLSFSASSAVGRRCSPNLLPPTSLGAWPSPCELEAHPSLTAMDWRLSGRWQGRGLHPHRWEEATCGCPSSARPWRGGLLDAEQEGAAVGRSGRGESPVG